MDETRIEKCKLCGYAQEVRGLQTRESERLAISYGYNCVNCGRWVHSFYMSPSLLDKQNALSRYKAGTGKYQKAFAKFRRKFDNFQKQMEGVLWREQHNELG